MAGLAWALLIGCGPPGDDGPDAAVPDAGLSDAGTGDAGTHVPACNLSAPTECPAPAPAWADVSPIFEAKCVQCHNGQPGNAWPLTTYSHVADWQNEIRDYLLDCSMPPPESAIELPESERMLLLTWIRCGLPR